MGHVLGEWPLGRVADSLEDVIATLPITFDLNDPGAVTAKHSTGSLHWKLYSINHPERAIEIAIAETDHDEFYVIWLEMPPDQRDWLYHTVFMPAVDAFSPLP